MAKVMVVDGVYSAEVFVRLILSLTAHGPGLEHTEAGT